MNLPIENLLKTQNIYETINYAKKSILYVFFIIIIIRLEMYLTFFIFTNSMKQYEIMNFLDYFCVSVLNVNSY